MAGYRYHVRRARRLLSSPAVRILLICAVILLFINFLLQYNHDPSSGGVLTRAPRPTTRVDNPRIDWSKLYYVQYVTSPEYLCNALMVWSQIEEIGSRAQRMMLYPADWSTDEMDEYDEALGLTPIARLLQQAVKDYYVTLRPVEVLRKNDASQETWADSYTKLLAFNLTEFDRVLAIDSDAMVLGNLDELFLFPAASLAMPYVYWGEPAGWQHSSQMMLIQPDAKEFKKIELAIEDAGKDDYDMDIVNRLYKGKIVRIPQRPYDLLSGEFRRRNHDPYLGSHSQKWDPDKALAEAKFLHFSDWPIPKPWIRAPKDLLNKYMPKCSQKEWFGATDCRDREIWLGLYYQFAVNRKAVCGPGFELQSRELPPESILRNGKWFHPDEVG